ncbi:hypothetical protein N665_0390s0021 [Sinapis alba]|nr:hypothetical protein N665_0390s0021 [Sinapis alba]
MNLVKFLIITVIILVAICPTLVQSRKTKCDWLGGNCIKGGDKETMKMSSVMDVSRRVLKAKRYIDYDALKHNVPAKQHGQQDRPDNPYRRRCTLATGCYRLTH